MTRNHLFVIPSLVALVFLSGCRRGHNAKWSYDDGPNGPVHWADLNPDYAPCNGKQQSPVDIRNPQKANLPPIRFEYKGGPFKIINNSYTAARLNYAPGNGNFLVVGDTRYELTQFHFHHPSEEYIDGKPYDMTLHLVHQAADGKLALVAVLLKAGSANATIQTIFDHMPPTPGKEHELPGVQVNPADLLPRNLAYYTYAGSLTAPPCTEGVTWFVLKTLVDVSPEEINAFAQLYPHDVRPLQPLNGRIVQEAQ